MPELDHEWKLIERLAATTEGNARFHEAYAREESADEESPLLWSQHNMLAASGFAIAASYWSLIEPRRAVDLYRLAAKKYRGMGHSYWMPLAFATVDPGEMRSAASAIADMPSPPPVALAFGMVANSMPGMDSNRDRVESLWQHAGNVPVGRLGIPMDLYGACARAMGQALRERSIERFRNAAMGYLNRAAEVLRLASHDSYHWQSLKSEILPAEPEAVAMSVAMSIVSHTVFHEPMTKIAEGVDRHGRLIVEVAEAMHGATGREPELRRSNERS